MQIAPFPPSFAEAISGPHGHFALQVFERGRLILAEDRPNMIVTNSKFLLSRLLGGTVANNSIVNIGFGIGAAAADPGNTRLTSAYVKAVDTVTFPATNQVQFNFSLAASEANGTAIWEFGLLSGAAGLFSRIVRSVALNKSSDISLAASWLITF